MNMGIPYNFINLGVWNIHGIFVKVNNYRINKLEDPAFLKRLRNFDILCLQEIQCGPQETQTLSVPGFNLIPFHRKRSENSRYYGGSLLCIKNSIRKGVKVIEALNDSIWLKLDKKFFHFENDVYFNITYAPPCTSEYTKNLDYDIFQNLEVEIVKYRGTGNVIIGGDFNAKTATESDCVVDQTDDHSPVNNNPGYISDQPIVRKNSDKHAIDNHGQRLLDLCKNSQLRILNGRTRGDRTGNFTRFPLSLRETPSVLDYMIADTETLKHVKNFSVLPRLGLSDHECLSLSLKTGPFNIETSAINIIKLRPIKYASVDEFIMKLNSPNSNEKIQSFLHNHTNPCSTSLENMTADLIDIINTSSTAIVSYRNKKRKKGENIKMEMPRGTHHSAKSLNGLLIGLKGYLEKTLSI